MAPLDAADIRSDDPTAFVRETGEVKALDLAVDAGAYRTWPEYTPVTHALIVEKLGTVRCHRLTAGIASMASVATQV